MIVAMKRCFVLLQEGYSRNSLEKLQQLGVIHVDLQRYESEEMALLGKELDNVQEVLKRLKLLAPKQNYQNVSNYDAVKTKNICEGLSELIREEKKNQEEIQILEETQQSWSAWGEFDPILIRELKNDGIDIRLFSLDSRQIQNLRESSLEYLIIGREGDKTLLAVVERGKFEAQEKRELLSQLPIELDLPEFSGKETEARIENLKQRNVSIEKTLRDKLFEQNVLYAYSQDIVDQLELEKTGNSLENLGDGLTLLSGYVPETNVNDLKLLAKNYSFGLVLREVEIESGDQAPTQLKQNFVSRLINPVLSFSRSYTCIS